MSGIVCTGTCVLTLTYVDPFAVNVSLCRHVGILPGVSAIAITYGIARGLAGRLYYNRIILAKLDLLVSGIKSTYSGMSAVIVTGPFAKAVTENRLAVANVLVSAAAAELGITGSGTTGRYYALGKAVRLVSGGRITGSTLVPV